MPDIPLHILIFSKDRAAQLDALLRSITDHFRARFDAIHILYRSSAERFALGYRMTGNRHRDLPLRWVTERQFRGDLLGLLHSLPAESFTMFLVDDDLLFRPFDPDALLERFTPEQHLFISTRCSREYTADTQPKKFLRSDPVLEWKWDYGRKPVTWNYPFSVDGNLYNTGVIRRYIGALDFSGPNSLEGRMHRYRHHFFVKKLRKAIAPLSPVLFNNPLNRVQTEGATFHGEVTAEFLNERFLEGQTIDVKKLYGTVPLGIHHLCEVSMSRRP